MADETKTDASATPAPAPEEKTPVDKAPEGAAATPPPAPIPAPAATTPPVSDAPKSKTNKAMVALLVLLFLVIGSGSFFAGRVTAPHAETTPTPSVAQTEEEPTVEPTEVPTPTVEATEVPTPTSAQTTPAVATPTP